MNYKILQEEVQNHIQMNLRLKVADFALKKNPFQEISSAELVQQFQGLKIAQTKFPDLLQFKQFIYPKHIHLEQASSQFTAVYKSKFFFGKFLDLTSGMGIDILFSAKNLSEINYLEPNNELFRIAKHNFKITKIAEKINFYNCKCEDFLAQNKNHFYDTIYIDPSRRKENQKVFLVHDLEPNLLNVQEIILKMCTNFVIKLSPLLDITHTIENIKNIHEIHLVAYKNELKEMLLVCKPNYNNEITIHCVETHTTEKLIFSYIHTKTQHEITYSEPLQFLYIPHVSLAKSGAFSAIANHYNLHKLHSNTHIYTSDEYKSEFMGQIYKVIDNQFDFKKSKCKKLNVICRNFPFKEEELKKKYKLTFCGTYFVICCKSIHQNNTILTQKLK